MKCIMQQLAKNIPRTVSEDTNFSESKNQFGVNYGYLANVIIWVTRQLQSYARRKESAETLT